MYFGNKLKVQKTLKLEINKQQKNIRIFRPVLLMAVHFHSAWRTVMYTEITGNPYTCTEEIKLAIVL